MHTRAAPRERLQDPDLYRDVTDEVIRFLGERIELALAHGVDREQLIVDPGPDFSKTPAQTIRLLSEIERLHQLGRPLLLAISRKDFIGALTDRSPRERSAGTLAALAHGLDHGASHLPSARRGRGHRLHRGARSACAREQPGQGSGARPRNCAMTGWPRIGRRLLLSADRTSR